MSITSGYGSPSALALRAGFVTFPAPLCVLFHALPVTLHFLGKTEGPQAAGVLQGTAVTLSAPQFPRKSVSLPKDGMREQS